MRRFLLRGAGHGQRKKHREFRAHIRLAFHHDLAAHQAHHLVADSHTQAGAAKAARGAGILLLKGLENSFQKFRLHANAGIFYTDHQIQLSALQEHLPESNRYRAFTGEFHGVGNKVDHHLIQAQAVAQHPVGGKLLIAHRKSHALFFHLAGKHIVQGFAEGTQAEGRVFQLHLAGLDAAHIQNIIDQRKHMIRKLFGFFHILHGGMIRGNFAFHQREHTNDAVHGGADLVRHTKQKAGFKLAGGLGFVQPLLISALTLVHGRAAVKMHQLIRGVAAGRNAHVQPLAIGHFQFVFQRFFTAPCTVAALHAAGQFGVFDVAVHGGDIVLQLLQRNPQQRLHIPHCPQHHGIVAAHQQKGL